MVVAASASEAAVAAASSLEEAAQPVSSATVDSRLRFVGTPAESDVPQVGVVGSHIEVAAVLVVVLVVASEAAHLASACK